MLTPESEISIHFARTGQELRVQGTPGFGCAGYQADGTGDEPLEVPWHYHPEFECMAVTEGVRELQVPGQTLRLTAGEGAFVNAGILHSARTEARCSFRALVFAPQLVYGTPDSVFYQSYIGPLQHAPGLACMALSRGVAWQRAALTHFEDACTAMAEPTLPGYEFRVRAALAELCLALFATCRRAARRPPLPTRATLPGCRPCWMPSVSALPSRSPCPTSRRRAESARGNVCVALSEPWPPRRYAICCNTA